LIEVYTEVMGMGATALETFGVQADPTTQELKPLAAIIGGFLASRVS
jgi:hypothetical protein